MGAADDLYDDLGDVQQYHENDKAQRMLDEANARCSQAEKELAKFKQKCSVAYQQNSILHKKNQVLQINISTLYKTAWVQLSNKDQQVAELKLRLRDVRKQAYMCQPAEQDNRSQQDSVPRSKLTPLGSTPAIDVPFATLADGNRQETICGFAEGIRARKEVGSRTDSLAHKRGRSESGDPITTTQYHASMPFRPGACRYAGSSKQADNSSRKKSRSTVELSYGRPAEAKQRWSGDRV